MKKALAKLLRTRIGPILSCCLLIQLLPISLTAQTVASTGGDKDQTTSQLLGIGIGTTFEEARSRLAQLGTGGGRDTREGGRKEAWTLRDTDFATLAFKTNAKGTVVWISAFVRPGKEIDFARLGKLAKATDATQSEAIWNVETGQGGYRLVAKGQNSKARVVYLLSLEFPAVQ
jgi:hypothetical protein